MDQVYESKKEDAAKVLSMWHKMTPLTVGNFQYFWDLLGFDVPMTDVEKAEYATLRDG